MRYYLSGPMSGLPEFNFPAFAAACQTLRAAGLEIVSPHEKGSEGDTGRSWESYLREDIELLCHDCHGFILLPGWTNSTGAKLELTIALALKMPVYFYTVIFSDTTVLVDMATGKIAQLFQFTSTAPAARQVRDEVSNELPRLPES